MLKFTATTDGASDPQRSTNKYATMYFGGTFDGATVTVQVRPDTDSSEWWDVTSTTEKALINEQVNEEEMRISVSGAGGSTDIVVFVR